MKHQYSSALSLILDQVSDPLYATPEAAAYLGLAENTLPVWRCVGRYDIPFIKVGRLVKYRKSALDAFLERRTRGQLEGQAINSDLRRPDEVRQKPKSQANPPGLSTELPPVSATTPYRRPQCRAADPPDYPTGSQRDDPYANEEPQGTENNLRRREK